MHRSIDNALRGNFRIWYEFNKNKRENKTDMESHSDPGKLKLPLLFARDGPISDLRKHRIESANLALDMS